MSGSRTLSSHSGASPQADSQDQRQQHALRAKVARWTVVLAGVGLVSYAVLPSEEKGSSKSSFASLFGRSGASHGELSAHLHPFRYGRFEVLSVHHTTTPSLLESDPSGDGQHVLLRIKASVDPAGQSKETGALRIESVYLKEPALQIERAYTPLRRPGNPTGLGVEAIPREEGHQPAEVIELLIKRYPDGELSRYASTLRAGDIVELRGPVSTWEWNRDHQNAADANTAAHSLPQDILMLVGGTGITTAHQLLHTVAHPSSRTGSTLAPSNPRVHILYATQRPSSLLVLPDLFRIRTQADQSSSILNLFAESIDSKAGDRDEPSVRSALLSRALEPGSLCKSASDGGALSPSSSWSNFFFGGRPTASQILGLPVQEGRITADAIEKSLQQIKEQRRRSTTAEGAAEAGSRPVILVCGPDGMVAALAGSKDQDGRGGQGALGGILKGLNISRSQVFKL
ncbi:unnamed protein product [Tilletia controversa]|uniref:FAD-binding FR-type domain-containing protein n=3 Tax=Tilletia TaxID=13289 RepID=A0A8X7SVH5_9BASI|nr:hypothetical protein CF336_g6023 [Tilletia laevis]KAE8192181.1 hypothetical protein CF328_g5452 [Tilletia controversa]KAE8256735.1 hypothetical protein A4X03_0g5108 [Tilletia caries]KAE8195310.1 hypothetical protein CF335_g5126 [Tilletia laevis]KAE8243572.1 hypothetical protein A4X06_0g6227 [Tilletia controversa]